MTPTALIELKNQKLYFAEDDAFKCYICFPLGKIAMDSIRNNRRRLCIIINNECNYTDEGIIAIQRSIKIERMHCWLIGLSADATHDRSAQHSGPIQRSISCPLGNCTER